MATGKHYIVGGGECGERIRKIDWSKTQLGPIAAWPQELLAVTNTILNSPLATVILANNGGYLIYNDGYGRFAGPKHPAILGQNYAEAWPEIAEYNRDMCARINAGETISYTEQVLQLRRGDEVEDVYMDLNYSPIFNADGEIIAMQVTVVEVTNAVNSRKTAEAALLDAKRQREVAEDIARINHTITQNASTALFIMDASFRPTFMNPAAEKMTGYVLPEMIRSKKTLHDLIHHSHADGSPYKRSECPINDAMRRMQQTSGDELFFRKDGTGFPVNFVASPIIQDGELASIIMEVRDMTQTEQLMEVNKAKDDFIAMASHQLRTPATSVKQYIGILMQEYAGPVNETQLQYLQNAYNANERQLVIIEDLLKTARVDMKGFKLKLRTTNLSKLLQDIAQTNQQMFASKDQQLSVNLPSGDISARFDRGELAICIDNLLENASKYSAAGKTITLSLKKLTKWVEISVKDDGVGIALGDQKAIFEKFTRISNELSDTVTGNGLGLYWVKRVVDLHKGTVIIKSAIGAGTTFTIRLPL